MYPAYAAIGRDIGLGFARWKVYMALQPPALDFATPRPVKLEWVMAEARVGRKQAVDALKWLTASGYVIEHSRDERGTRSLLLAYTLDTKAA